LFSTLSYQPQVLRMPKVPSGFKYSLPMRAWQYRDVVIEIHDCRAHAVQSKK
jgi:hypothetical protein